MDFNTCFGVFKNITSNYSGLQGLYSMFFMKFLQKTLQDFSKNLIDYFYLQFIILEIHIEKASRPPQKLGGFQRSSTRGQNQRILIVLLKKLLEDFLKQPLILIEIFEKINNYSGENPQKSAKTFLEKLFFEFSEMVLAEILEEFVAKGFKNH